MGMLLTHRDCFCQNRFVEKIGLSVYRMENAYTFVGNVIVTMTVPMRQMKRVVMVMLLLID